ncbi:MAG TPA: hypothetical protein DHW61_15645 [Lachnoclostridium phytofermentans]|uniref:Bro-N domain-containing protein n=1 Tax=Lachnoclostridium phytofermentans TaxID=66219 RepID=A0A3D2XA50_9FIRM|nr:phage antirepressor KilAC domain-containing protein [Lachnoclostridium sp.]HCL03814.1 hypothetical protein [Lachnoclostridium phytofermentans]
MEQLKIFESEDFGQVRTNTENGKIYFCGSDVARALGYARPNEAITRHCKGTLKRSIPTTSGRQEMLVISEGDIYRLVVKSQMPYADQFESWIFDDVIPCIRKHGMYATDELINNPDFLIQVATALKEEREKNKQLLTEVNVKNQLIGELKPKADYMDQILNNKGLVTITQIAKDYGMSGQAMNELLHSLKVQYKQSEQWLLYSSYHDLGYTHSTTVDIKRKDGTPDVKMNTKWTQKGRLFLYELLKSNGYLPVIEQNKIA